MNILNYKEDKVEIKKKNRIVRKDSSLSELSKLQFSEDYFTKCPIKLNCGFKVKTAPIVDFSGNFLITKFCEGINLEHVLIGQKNGLKKRWVILFREFFDFLRKRGFLWGDLAPRNMVIDTSSMIIYLFDFERDLTILDRCVDKHSFSDFFCTYAFEEFSSMIKSRDQKKVFFEYIWNRNSQYEIPPTDIKSTRRKELLRRIFGNKKIYTSEELHYIQNLISFISTPVDYKFTIYPIFLLNKIAKEKGVVDYAEIVNRLSQCSSEQQKFFTLKEIVREFCFGFG